MGNAGRPGNQNFMTTHAPDSRRNRDALQDLPWRSRVPGIDWPALMGMPGDLLVSLLWQLEETQWLPPAELEAQQFSQLGELLQHAQQTVPFYRKHLQGVDLQRELTAEFWRTLPILNRSMVQTAGQELVSRQPPPSHGRMTKIQTSGSTGQPVTVFGTEATGMFWHALTIRGHLWHKRDLRAKLASIRTFAPGVALPPNGAPAPAWGSSSALIFEGGPCASLNISATIREQADWLMRNDPTYLLSYPSNLAALARHMTEKRIRLAHLREVWTIGETLPQHVRTLLEETWRVPVIDTYSSQECGYLAIQCPVSGLHHIQSESALVEILDERGQPCGPGEIGRVVVTPLHNFATPLIRYEIGDYAEAGEICPCGRGLPTLRRVVGRQRNMLRLPNGDQRWPPTRYPELVKVAPIRQFQLVQKTVERIEARFVVERELTTEEEKQVIGIIQQKLGYSFEVALTYSTELPRSRSGKFEEFISELPSEPRL